MTEDKTQKEEEEKQSDDNSKDGSESEMSKETRLANEASERMVKEREKLEQATAKAKLAGVAEGGSEPVKKEETPQDYAKKVMANDLDGSS